MSDFFIGLDRAMISLGPLSSKKYCTYNCSFCYVSSNFKKYTSLSNEEIFNWLVERKNEYSIIYISGDTDSFAPPRTEQAMCLLEKLVSLNVDILFTTRAVLDDDYIERIKNVSNELKKRGQVLFSCISISSITEKSRLIEPKPIPTTFERIDFIKKLHSEKIITILALRPFLPIISFSDYIEIIKLSSNYVYCVLGEQLIFDSTGIIEKRIFKNNKRILDYKEEKVDFDISSIQWRVWEAKEITKEVTSFCKNTKIPFFMRSQPAIQYLKKVLK